MIDPRSAIATAITRCLDAPAGEDVLVAVTRTSS